MPNPSEITRGLPPAYHRTGTLDLPGEYDRRVAAEPMRINGRSLIDDLRRHFAPDLQDNDPLTIDDVEITVRVLD